MNRNSVIKKIILKCSMVWLLTISVSSFSSCGYFFEYSMICKFQGYFQSLERLEEEFAMLLEPQNHPNFQWVSFYVISFLDCLEEQKHYVSAFTDPECNVSEYAKQLLIFFHENKANIKSKELVMKLESFDKKMGKVLFNIPKGNTYAELYDIFINAILDLL